MPNEIKEYQKAEIAESFDMEGFEDYAGAGLEEVRASDLLIPRLVILQSTSPAVQEEDSSHRIGDLYNITTGENYGRKLRFVGLFYWLSRTMWESDDINSDVECTSADGNMGSKYGRCGTQTGDGCHWKDWSGDGENRTPPRCTDFKNIVILPQAENGSFVDSSFMIYAAKRAALRSFNRFLTATKTLSVNGKTPPLFATVWELSTEQQTNDKKGAKYYTPKFTRVGYITKDASPLIIHRFEEFKQIKDEMMNQLAQAATVERAAEGAGTEVTPDAGLQGADDLDDDKSY